MILYINPTGALPNGVSSFSYHLLEQRSDARALVLGCDDVPDNTPTHLRGQISTLPEDLSHNRDEVAAAIAHEVERTTDTEVVIAPNNSDLVWMAVNDFLKSQTAVRLQAQKTIRVLGIIHSDIYTQYDCAKLYEAIAPVWIAVSERCASVLGKQSPQLRIHTLPYPTFVPPTLPNRSDGKLRLAYVGRLETEQKQIFHLLDLAAALKAKGVDFTLSIVGDGPSASELAARVESQSLGDCVELLGTRGVQEVRQLLGSHHIFVLTSKYEGFPIALMEAMAHGCAPVVMQIDSGIGQLLEHRQNSIVTPQGDIAAMADAIAGLDSNREELARLGTNAHQTIARNYSPEVYFPKFAKVLEQLLATPAPNPHKSLPDPTAAMIADLVERSQATGLPAVVYGSGVMGRRIVDELLKNNVEVVAMIDSNPKRAGSTYRGITCNTPTEIINFSEYNFVIGSSFYAEEIASTIRKALPPQKKPSITAPQKA